MVHYTEPSRYNWMLQYYLRAEGLALSWVGTGRLIFSLNYTEADFAEVTDRFVAASEKMKRDGWWWQKPAHQQEHQAADPERDACRTVQALRAALIQLPSWPRLIPAIQRFSGGEVTHKTWMPGTRPGMTKVGHWVISTQACLTCSSRPGSISSPFSRNSGAL